MQIIPTLAKAIILLSLGILFSTLTAKEPPAFMGNWEGHWIEPEERNWKKDPGLVARVIGVGQDRYQIQLLQEFYKRARPYYTVEAKAENGVIKVNQDGWNFTITNNSFKGTHTGNKHTTAFTLEKAPVISPTLGLAPPENAVVLFDGTNLDKWGHDKSGRSTPATWAIVDGVMECVPRREGNKAGGNLLSKERFGSFTMHIEFRLPYLPENSGQDRGNSGVFINDDSYEVQVLDSYGLDAHWDDCGALYRVSPPKVNASAPPGTWQTYDITFQLADEAGDPVISVLHNGVPIHTETVMETVCGFKQIERLSEKHPTEPGRIKLQDHGHRVQYRNIWVVPED